MSVTRRAAPMRLLTVLFLLLPLGIAFADTAAVLAQADGLHDGGHYTEARKLLLDSIGSAAGGKEQAELYWRAARETLELGDSAEKAGKPQADILALFVEGEGYADKAIAADAGTDLGYYWKSANIGRWGQVKGIFDSLSKAQPMKDLLVKDLSINPDRSDAYFVLGQLYRELPGWPLSFGNIDAAVSLGRKAVDLRLAQVQAGTEKVIVYSFPTELAKTLYKRNWSAATRVTEQKNKAGKLSAAATPLDKASLYEATISLKNVSDREEAKAILQQVVSDANAAPSLTVGDAKDVAKARELLKGW
jgi:tetratricopeptide (TPR) repeat protein